MMKNGHHSRHHDWRSALSDERMLDREAHRDRPELWSATSPHGMVATAHYRATRAGVEILEAGGNAVDAAAAASFALAVVEPAGSGLGGMAMLVLHSGRSGRTVFLPGPCRAPRRATPAEVGRSERYTGYGAVAVPTFVSVMDHALRRHGTLPPERVLEPAIALAEEGFPLTPAQSRLIADHGDGLARSTAAPFFLRDDGSVPQPGTLFRQSVLAGTLRRLARAGLRDFYEGGIAEEIARDMEAHGGFIRADDLAGVGDPPETEPVRTAWRGGTVCAPGPPAGGRTLLEMLNLLSELSSAGLDVETPGGVEILAAVIRRARMDRRRFRLGRAGDPDIAGMEYARDAAASLREEIGSGETSHISVMDREGNAVSLTQSIERSFGARVVTPGLGFLHNGFMKGFKIQRKDHPHFLRPGAVARSNAAPTLVIRDGRPVVAVGNTGSERMLSGILTTLVRLERQGPFEAVHAPRLHVTPEGRALVEPRFPLACIRRLEERGYAVELLEPYAFTFGGLQLVTRQGVRFHGVGEPRRDGAAAGPER